MAMKPSRIILIVVLLIIAIVVAVSQLSQRVPEKTVLRLEVSGRVEEEDWPDFSAKVWEGDVIVFRRILEALDRAKRDDNIAGVSLEIKNVGMGLAQIQELRTKLAEFTAAGKWCTSYLEFGDNRSYYLATACPQVYLTPTSTVFVTSLMGHSTFLRGALDKLRIYPDMYSIAEYKTAKNFFTEKKFTPAHREVVVSLLTTWQQQIVEGIGKGRSLTPEQADELIRNGPYMAKEAVDKKLVDQLLFYDEYKEQVLKKKAGVDELKLLSWSDYVKRTSTPFGAAKIALVHATGPIVTGSSGYEPGEGRYMGSDTVAKALRDAADDDSIKAIVFRIESPGGSALASEIIRREVVRAKTKKPVVVSMSNVAGSGGYWIAMSANKIVADPGTITGSIGVVFGKLNVKGLFDMLGLTSDYVALSPNATFLYSYENFTPQQVERLMAMMQEIYDNFLDGVSQGRGIPKEEVHRIGRGRVWLGSQAKELRLVDEVGGLDVATAIAKNLAKIPADQAVQYEVFPREKTPLEQLEKLFESQSRGLLGAARHSHWVQLLQEPVLVLMPFELEVR
ncbi:MAG TPA: signal peptide peptidase SppA [Candidatus Xenobia bacterium]|nr:signal peptide peptidase SppA [Candidatus Xenobia bacterium]